MCTFLEPRYEDTEHFQSPQIIKVLFFIKNYRDTSKQHRRQLEDAPTSHTENERFKIKTDNNNGFQLIE